MPEPFNYDRLAAFEKIIIDYHGSGDEGHIEDITTEPKIEGLEIAHDLYSDLDDWAGDVLTEQFGGWEINEGSSGQIIIDVKARTTSIDHNWIVETTEHEGVEF